MGFLSVVFPTSSLQMEFVWILSGEFPLSYNHYLLPGDTAAIKFP